MFRIKFQPVSKTYKFEKADGSIYLEGTIHQVSRFAIQQGIKQSELTFAYEVMSKQLHTIAEFGLTGCFLYSHGGLRGEKRPTPLFH